jgi:hypothetical protein
VVCSRPTYNCVSVPTSPIAKKHSLLLRPSTTKPHAFVTRVGYAVIIMIVPIYCPVSPTVFKSSVILLPEREIRRRWALHRAFPLFMGSREQIWLQQRALRGACPPCNTRQPQPTAARKVALCSSILKLQAVNQSKDSLNEHTESLIHSSAILPGPYLETTHEEEGGRPDAAINCCASPQANHRPPSNLL